eukprot:Phypoly_transcript_14904.p1 GENE.Phypoly_transcript_14904~~Phypoly_transcript_14904.p1  ORF type:complete len:160 (+),score=23.34 Phypoly_transcript_14904:172-651(+)
MNITEDTTKVQIQQALASQNIRYTNLAIITNEDDENRVKGAHFMVAEEGELRQCTEAIVFVQLGGFNCKLEESVTNFNSTHTIYISNLPKCLHGPSLINYIKINICKVFKACIENIKENNQQKPTPIMPLNFAPPLPLEDIWCSDKILFIHKEIGFQKC